MNRTMRWATLGGVVLLAVFAASRPIATTGAAHTFLHLSCPPGSHGSARSDGVGRSLMDARDSGRSSRP